MISNGNCVCGNLKWQLRLRKSQMAIAFAEISNGNCVCGNLKWQLRLRKSQMAIAFAEISNGNCVCGNLKWQKLELKLFWDKLDIKISSFRSSRSFRSSMFFYSRSLL